MPTIQRSSVARRAASFAVAFVVGLGTVGCASSAPNDRAAPSAAPPRSLAPSSGGARTVAGGPAARAGATAIEADPYGARARDGFDQHCTACHGARGEGRIGPNLTDGVSISVASSAEDYRVIIRDGIPPRGMPGWGRTLDDPALVASIARYVWSLRNTNAAGGTPAQGSFVLR